MEKFQTSLIQSKKSLQIADHMIFVTYNVVNDARILLSSVKNIFNSLMSATESLLHYERLFKRIPIFPQNTQSKLTLLKDNCLKTYDLSQNYLYLINELNELLEEHKKSPIEFSRKDKFVICTPNYSMKTVTPKKIKEYITLTKKYIEDIEKIVTKHNEIFK